MKRVVLLLWVTLSMVLGAEAMAHSMGLSLLRMSETQAGEFRVFWQPSSQLQSKGILVRPDFPSDCALTEGLLSCPTGYSGSVQFDQLPPHAEVVLQQDYLSGERKIELVTDRQVQFNSSPQPQSTWRIFGQYTVIGVEHILFGPDHLLFVFALILLVGFSRQLVATITAFTVSHTLTLCLTVLGWVSLPTVPVEIIIALSIVLVAREALSQRQTAAKRWPWLVAFLFGLVHGFGFASALGDIGLQPQALGISLFAFNLGVELGQLLVLLPLYGLVWLFKNLRESTISTAAQLQIKTLLCYGLGICATFWTIERSWSGFTPV